MNVMKKLQYENTLKVRPLINAFKEEFLSSEFNRVWATQIRELFLKDEIKRLSKQATNMLIGFKKFKELNPPEWLVDVAYELSKTNDLLRKIKKYKNLLLMKENTISSELIQRCRDYPMENLIEIVRHGSPKFGMCKLHNDKDPSFAIYDDNSWHCFGCKKTGQNAIDYIMARDNISFMQAIIKIKEMEV